MITVVLVKPQNENNIGFIARAMANFDLNKLILIESLADHLGKEAILTSKHASKIIEKAKVEKYSYFKKLKKEFDLIVGTTAVLGSDYNIPRIPLEPEELAKKIENQKTAIVFGNEASGLSNDEIKLCDFLITIPTSRKYSTMNISHAASIIFYELYKESGKNKINSHIKKASPKEREVMLNKLDNIMKKLDFSTDEKIKTQEKTWKNVFEKSMMSKREAFAVIGLLKKIEDEFSIL